MTPRWARDQAQPDDHLIPTARTTTPVERRRHTAHPRASGDNLEIETGPGANPRRLLSYPYPSEFGFECVQLALRTSMCHGC